MMKDQVWISRKEEIVERVIDSEVLVYDLKTDQAHSLNKSASILRNICDSKKTLDEIVHEFERETNQTNAEEIVKVGLNELIERDLIHGDMIKNALDRRKLLKKTALVGAAALPVVMSIVVPTAVQAQSALPPGAPCQNSPQCANSQCVGVGGGNKICRI